MSSYKHKSGAQKRRERQERVDEEKKGSRTLFDVGVFETNTESYSAVPLRQDFQIEDEIIEPQQQASEVEITDSIAFSSTDDGSELPFNEGTASTSRQFHGLKFTQIAQQGFDIGTLTGSPTPNELEEIVRAGHIPHPNHFPCDVTGSRFPISILSVKKQNGETSRRCWIVFSPIKKAIYCFPCRLFWHTINNPTPVQSSFASADGWGPEKKWKKLWDRIPEHEKSGAHKKCYLSWRELQRRVENNAGIDVIIEENILSEAAKWKRLLSRIIDVVIFLGQRGLAFRGSTLRIGDVHNGNFLGLLELLAHYDPILEEHVTKVEVAQQKGERLQAHYLSPESQNEFISMCAARVKRYILDERELAKYYSIMVDATPDSSHIEQTAFILRYLTKDIECYVINERFLAFVDCCQKTGIDIANLIVESLKKYGIPIDDCRGQGYDNAANMSGKYSGAQQHISSVNPLCLYSPCGCHSLNLCGADSASSCTEAITYFGMVQTIYNLFSSSPQRWQILQRNIACSLHGLSGTRWTDRVASVRPFAAHLPNLKVALQELLSLNLSPKAISEVNGAIKYVSSFTCLVMSSLWLKILVAIDQRNQIIQARKATIDVEVSNLKSLLEDLKKLREKWPSILRECKLVASATNIQDEFPSKRKSKRRANYVEIQAHTAESTGEDHSIESEEERAFKHDVFYVIVDCVIAGLTTRYVSANSINDLFCFLWQYLELSEDQILQACDVFGKKYTNDVSGNELKEEVLHLKAIHAANFGSKSLPPLELLSTIRRFKLEEIFSNVCIALRIFCTLPVTVASAERSFSKLKLIKNFLRSTMGQGRLNDLALLSIEAKIAKCIDLQDVINDFAVKKARKAFC